MSPLFKVNYYLIYGTSETAFNTHIFSVKVKYCLIYGISETFFTFERSDLR